MDADVVIAGAGPTGLMLACELRLAGLDPVVLERLTEPTGLSKALGLVGRAVDALDNRGLLGRFQDQAAIDIPRAAHFALIPLDVSQVRDLGLRAVFIQQAATEEILASHARELGVRIWRGRELVALAQDADSVSIQVTGPDGGIRCVPGTWLAAMAARARFGSRPGSISPACRRPWCCASGMSPWSQASLLPTCLT